MSGRARLGDAGLGCVGQESWGRSGSVGSDGWRGVGRVAWAGRVRAQGRSVGHAGFGWLVGPLDPDDESSVHHPR
jgi:hypothetical protein